MIDPEVMRRLDQQASLIRQLQGALGGMRVVRGVVNGTGTAAITEGEGFSLTDNGTGDYTITFDTAFSDVPAVVVTAGETAGNLVAKLFTSAPTASAFRVALFASNTGSLTDSIFHFVAIGPA